jgi:two-component system response regulator NreC
VKTYRTIVVEDETIVASMLLAWLAEKPFLTVVGSAPNGKEGLVLCRKTKPELALLDIEMPEMDGLTLAAKIREEFPDTKIIILSSHCDPYHVYQITRLRINGYVEKTCPLTVLSQTIEAVLNGQDAFSDGFETIRKSHLKRSDAFHKILTQREISILMMVVDGVDDDEIAKRLDITPSTVATHRRNLRFKLEAHNDRDLVNYARQWGLISLDPPGSASLPDAPTKAERGRNA